jgi:nicotinate-nucleotide adenylyltransferase
VSAGPQRIGVFGGTFDPPHLGHAAIAGAAQRQLELDRVEWVVSARPPHRENPCAAPHHRLAMVALATLFRSGHAANDRELGRAGASYMVETLRSFRADWPECELVLILGADAYLDLDQWNAPDEIRRLARLAVIPRSGAPTNQVAARADERVSWLQLEPQPHRGRELRAQLQSSQTSPAGIDPLVLQYARKYLLYSPQGNV